MGALSLTACAGTRGTLAGDRPRDVAVVVETTVATPPAQNVFDAVGGTEAPASLLGRESVRALQGRGYGASMVERVKGTTSAAGPALAAEIAGGTGNDAALLVSLESMKLESMRSLGRAEIDLQVHLVAADGTILWSGSHRGATRVTTYKAKNDWRAHLRAALDDALGELP